MDQQTGKGRERCSNCGEWYDPCCGNHKCGAPEEEIPMNKIGITIDEVVFDRFLWFEDFCVALAERNYEYIEKIGWEMPGPDLFWKRSMPTTKLYKFEKVMQMVLEKYLKDNATVERRRGDIDDVA